MGYAETLTVQDGRPLEDFELVAWDGSHKSFEVISPLSHRLRSERQSREGDSVARAIDFSCRSGGCRVAKSPPQKMLSDDHPDRIHVAFDGGDFATR